MRTRASEGKLFKQLHISLVQFLESYKLNGLISTLHDSFYINRELIILENDLSSLGPRLKCLSDLNLDFIEISKSNFKDFHLQYPFRSRYLKTLNNLNKGYRSFVVTRGNVVIGDLWFTHTTTSKASSLHHDLKWLKMNLGEEDVYGWDMYVGKEERGNSAAIYLMSQALHYLREKGFTRVRGFVFVDNIAASFFYKILKFKELKKLRADRFLFFRRVRC